jgi:hypothetical protein
MSSVAAAGVRLASATVCGRSTVCCSVAPEPDAKLAAVRPGGERDVGDERPQQPLAVALRGAVGGPQCGQVARDETVVRLALVECALGARGVVAGALDPQLERAAGPAAALGDLVGGGERGRDLLRCHRLEQPVGDERVDDARLTRPAAGRRDVVRARA